MSFEGRHAKEEKCEVTYKRYVLCLPDACQMHTWTLFFIILSSHIIATYIMIITCFTLIYEDLRMIPFIWFTPLQNRNSLFCVFFTQRPIRSQIDLGFLEHHFFIGRSTLELWRRPGWARGPKECRWHAQTCRARHPCSFGRRSSNWPKFFAHRCILT
jgi:hypothetical protein